jgi:TRAP-type C4-dicarboxylate transport system substrate-binding protein
MIRMKQWSPLMAVGTLMLAMAPASAQTFTMKMSGIAINDPSHEHMKLYKDLIEQRSSGRIKAEIYPGAQLGGFPRMIEGLQLGTLEFYTGPPAFQRGLDPRMQVVDAPGLFENAAHGQKTVTDPRFRDKFLDLTTSKGLKGVTIYNWGPTQYASNSPLRKLDDFKGKKFRVLASKVEIEVMNRVGATGVPMDFTEVLPSLQNKTLDGVRSSIVVMGAAKFFSVTKYITTVNDTMVPLGAWVSVAWFDKLPADLQKIVTDAGREMDEAVYKLCLEFDSRAVQLWKDNGAEVIALPQADQAEFMRRVRTVADDVPGGDPALKDMYNLYKDVAESHRTKRG